MGGRQTAIGFWAAALLALAAVLPACGGGGPASDGGPHDALGGRGGAAGGGAGTGGGMAGGGGTGGTGGAGGTGTIPLTGVYVHGSSDPGFCGGDTLERFWPTRATVYYTGFDCSTNLFVFRPTDGQLFYDSVAKGILIDGAGNADSAISTPPCGTSVSDDFGFDGQGRLYYDCSGTVLRGNGESRATNVSLAGVLADGRMIVVRAITTAPGAVFVVIGPDGSDVNTLHSEVELGVPASPDARATTVAGNDGYVLLERQNDPDPPELDAYHLDAQSRWSLVRRLAGVTRANRELVISDGTIFVIEQANPQTSDLHVAAYLPGSNTSLEVWHEGQSPVLHDPIQLLIGPLDAFGPSTMME